MSTVHVVAPVYDEREILDELHRRLAEVLDGTGYDWGIVYADDGSSDGTADWIEETCEADARVRAVHLARNFGQQLAIAAGLAVTDADAVVVMDADLQDPPEVIPRLLERWEEGYDVVYAVKKTRREGWLRRTLTSLFYEILRRLSAIEIPKNAGNFSLMDRSVVRLINSMPERDRYVSGLRAYVGGRQTGVEFDRPDRASGPPRQSPGKLMRLAANALFAFSDVPLRIATFLGIGVAAISFPVLVWVLYQKLVTGEAILGWASVMTSVLFLGGIQLVALGIIGEYIGRIYHETRRRPAYVVERYRNVAPPADREPVLEPPERGRAGGDEEDGPAAGGRSR